MAGKKILVADDSLTIQKVIRLALSNEGYEIQAVSDGNDALQQIAVFRPHVVLIDVSLPAKTAFEVKRAINDLGDSQTRFILMSSAFEKVDDAKVAEVQFHGHLTKPFDPAHLRHVLTQVLASDAKPSAPAKLTLDSPAQDDPLWSDESTKDFSSLPEFPGSGGSELDIKHLTESTIKMSGLDEFQWSVNETSKKAPPPPPSSPYDSQDPALKPFPGSFDLGGSTFKFESFEDAQEQSAPREEKTYTHSGLDLTPPPAPVDFQFNTAQMEEMIRNQVQETLEKMAQRILPEVAERVIKAEINKLLHEQY